MVAFANRNDRHHAWAVELVRHITFPILTCEAVLTESAYHLQNPEIVLKLVAQGSLRIAFDVESNLLELSALAVKFKDRHPDLADLCLIRISELYPLHTVLTVDHKDFSIYRRNRTERIPFISPLG